LENKLDNFSAELDSLQDEISWRKKQLNRFVNFAKFVKNQEYEIDDLISKTIKFIPYFFRFPNSLSVSITYGNKTYKAIDIEKLDNKISHSKIIRDKNFTIKVYYENDLSFIEEEKHFLTYIGELLTLSIENRKLKERQQKLNYFYRDILNGIKNGVWVSNEYDVIQYCNNGMENIAGVPKEKIINKNVLNDFSDKAIREFGRYYKHAKKSLKPVKYDNISVLTLGGRVSVQSGWLIPRTEDHQYKGMICTIDDSTEKKQIKDKLDEKKSLYEAIISSNSIGVAMVDMKGHPIESNRYLHEMFGYNEEKLKNMHFKEFTHPADNEKDLDLYRELIAGKREYYRIEKRYIHKDGSIVWGYLTATLIRDPGGTPKYVISLVQDITGKKETEKKLRKSRENLKMLNEKLEMKVRERTKQLSKSQKEYKIAFERANFYKNLITHDMSNILQNIYSSVELISLHKDDSSYQEKLGDYIRILEQQTKRAINFIKNARSLTEIGNTKHSFKKIDLIQELNKFIQLSKKIYKSKALEIEITSELDHPYIKANNLLHEIFENLISNSIKYNDSSLVIIIIHISRQTIQKKDYIRLEFIDNGIGISDTRKDHIFDQMKDKKFSRRGMGLGLSLVNCIVNIFKGKIWIENRIEDDYTKGSKFILLLPEY